MGRFIVIVLDGFGIGYMDDVSAVRPSDLGANTFLSIVKSNPNIKLPTLEKLGLMNIAGFETENMRKIQNATYGMANLTHFWADTFWGHQEIMGTRPKMPVGEPMKKSFNIIKQALELNGYKIREFHGEKERILIVNEALTVGDNIECDPGLAINITAAIDDIAFDEVKRVGEIVRGVVEVARVIAFGGSGVHLEDILAALEEKENGYMGINAPASGVYRENYHCVHLGFGVDNTTQIPFILHDSNIKSYLLGKAADIIFNPIHKNSFSIVPTNEVFDKTLEIMNKEPLAFICANVQETDLAGHRQDAELYCNILEIADRRLEDIIENMNDEDILIVMADHGNDPLIGHPQHTREKVPLMICGKKIRPHNIGLRATLSDVAATAAQYFKIPMPENGTGFLNDIYDENI